MDKSKRIVIEDDDEEEPVQIGGSTTPNDETVSMCLIGKLWTTRSYNSFGMVETMKKLWNPTQGMTCRDLGFNLMSFQFNTPRDMRRVMDMEPWHLKNMCWF